MSGHTEHDFETAIETELTGSCEYEKRSPSVYGEAFTLFSSDVTGFLKENQPARRQALEALLRPRTAATVPYDLSNEQEREATLNKDGIDTAIAAHSSIGTRPARCTRIETRFGSNRSDG